ncbi:uncharacterized protein LOC113372794 [Ctenocephalides felis]|uniref:uncharacterized protein LOC113372794 n=1 Tax=Ctenocephalides felis TaxID=7515 RepID=UPI000E6E49A1|nr:uncharacterized protein LOC113372794 [Ctenocephalides felis]
MSYNRGRFNYRKRGFSRGGSSSSGRSTPSNESSVQSFTNSANLPEVVRRSGEQPLISVALDVIPGPYQDGKVFPFEGDPVFSEDWPMFQEDLREKPEYTLNCLGLAMHQVR